jgi:adenylosuccinate synthase
MHFPYSIEKKDVTPIYTEFKGWQEDLTKATNKNDIPKVLNEYIAFIENYVGVPITILSVGPDRKQTLFLKKILV